MATSTKQPFNYYTTGKYGTLPQKDMEVSQDMHLKMSKKIAQLTKVIYALNTKNDEHESIISSIKEEHEDQIQQIVSETRAKLEQYRNKIGNDVEQKRKIHALKDAVEEYERQKKIALADFERFKKTAENREHDIKTEHTQKIISFSKEIASLKRDSEDQLVRYESLQLHFESEKQSLVDDLRSAHKKEINELLKTQNSQQSNLDVERNKLQTDLEKKLQKLQETYDNLHAEKNQIISDYDAKINKAQLFYEKELQALKDSQNKASGEQIQDLNYKNDKLLKDYAFLEGQSKKRINELLQQLVTAEDNVNQYKAELEKLTKEFNEKESDSTKLSRQLYEVKNELSDAFSRLQLVENDLSSSKHRVEDQADELLKRSTQIGELEATRLQNDATIKDLRIELDRLREKLNNSENEKGSLEVQSTSHYHESTNKIRSLERQLEDIQVDKTTMQQKLERDISNLQSKTKKTEKDLNDRNEHTIKMLTDQHTLKYNNLMNEKDAELDKIKKELESMLTNESLKFRQDFESQQAEYGKVKMDLSQKLQKANEEILKLQHDTSNKDIGLSGKSSEIQSLQLSIDKVRDELEHVKKDYIAANNDAIATKEKLNKLKALHEASLHEAAQELEKRLHQLSSGKDLDWENKIKEACSRIQQQVQSEKEAEMEKALAALSKQKDSEISAARNGWETKINELLQQVSLLKSNIRNKDDQSTSAIEQLKKETNAENHRLENEILRSAEEYNQKILQLKRVHSEELQRAVNENLEEQMVFEANLKAKHIEEMKYQLLAHKSAIDALKEQTEHDMKTQIEKQTEKTKKEIEKIQTELRHKHSHEIEQYSRAHQNQMAAARLELDRALELAKQKETQYSLQVDELQDDIKHREQHILTLEGDINKLQLAIDELSKELEHKGKEILFVRSDANQQIRKREEQLTNEYRQEKDLLESKHNTESQEMLEQFNIAQEILKDRIAEAQLLLEEAVERFRNRESKPEDLELIAQLRAALQDKEAAMKKLLDDKKYYQMELVNRETNFNKVFSSTPNVGVMNPLVKPKKNRRNSSTTSLGRLDPLPGSPFHEESLNPSKPLPPPHKKFLR